MGKRYDLHIHSIFSDGELIPAEIAQRCAVLDHAAIAITDHVDNTNMDFIINSLADSCQELSQYTDLEVLPGVEITHLPLGMIAPLAKKAKNMGAKVVIVHGETLAEPVRKGTNLAAVKVEEVDILSHPGLITKEEAELARKNNIFLELTSRKGHCLTNGYVVKIATEVGNALLLNTDAHAPEDLIDQKTAIDIAMGCGLSREDSKNVVAVNPESFLGII
ncbi:MAG: histidinol phosphate phosphatase domain-containing protein [Candidatus Hydrothermarchaeales archaeon]